jgi:hypothetical protein
MLADLNRAERLQLMKFVCSFAWADLDISTEERLFVADCIRRLKLDEAERRQVWEWIETPPAAEEVDPTAIPKAHRRLFVDTVNRLVRADQQLTSDELANLELFNALLS